MKKLLLVLFSAGLACNTSAQSLSAGLRTGPGASVDIRNTSDANISWDKEAYFRLETNKRIAVEAFVTHYSSDTKYETREFWGGDFFSAPYYSKISNEVNSNQYTFGASFQYDITCPMMKEHCPVMKNISSFIGLDAGIRYNNEKGTQYGVRDADGVIERMDYTNNYADVLIGLSHTVKYNLSEKFYLISTTRAMLDTKNLSNAPYAISRNDSHIGFKLGVGYNF